MAEAFQRIDRPAKTLSLVGWQSAEMIMHQQNLWPEDARVLGHVSQSQLKDCDEPQSRDGSAQCGGGWLLCKRKRWPAAAR